MEAQNREVTCLSHLSWPSLDTGLPAAVALSTITILPSRKIRNILDYPNYHAKPEQIEKEQKQRNMAVHEIFKNRPNNHFF